MKILLDTNLLIEAPRLELLAQNEDHIFVTSALSYAELLEGEFSPNPVVQAQAMRDWVKTRALYGAGLPFDDNAAQAYLVICQTVTAHSRQVGRARRIDLMIAAIALVNGCTLATKNTADFAGLDALVDIIEL